MAQIIKQPYGLYCLFSSVVDNVTHYDLTEDEIIDIFIEKEKQKITENVRGIINKLERGEKPYFQFTMTYDEMIDFISEVHGEKEANKIKKLIK